jgi:putative FmdB family regulatory protein
VPIYAYRCESCGFTKDVLQKVSDAPLTECPSCSKSAFRKQVTAAGFQLKGTGWYVTDFRNGSGAAGKPAQAEAEAKPETKTETKSEPAAPATGTTGTTGTSGNSGSAQ